MTKRKPKSKKISPLQQTKKLVKAAIYGMHEKKGKDIISINLRKIPNAVCSYFIICNADSHAHVEAIARSVEEVVWKMSGEKPWHTEGRNNAEWILIDYSDVVAHVFLSEVRVFYNLEGMWADAEIKTASFKPHATGKNQ